MLELKNVSFVRSDRYILRNINISIEPNQNWVILGKNGSGKTTLINLIFGYHWPTVGIVKVFGKTYGEFPVRNIQRRIGILQSYYQEERVQRNLSVKEVIATGLLNSIGIYSDLNSSQEEKLELILKKNLWIKNPDQNYSLLSAGEKKKILLLRALISDPEILILDEPCSSLDLSAREDFFALLEAYKLNGRTIILITHRTDEIPNYFNYALLLKDGEIVASGLKEKIFTSDNLSNTYDLKVELIERSGQYFTNVIK